MGSGVSTGENRAQTAAEAAISSPLLEDINLAGARGVLVNVTAGMDLSIGEFRQVGDTIKQFASDEATVVIGTVIDPEMTQELRVTVVATGLGQAATAETERPRVRAVPRAERKERERNYADLETPAVQRRRAVGDGIDEPQDDFVDLLDIPAFLRKQQD
ncbi:MAG TPA: cell division protein FtsZ, partial [Gammaproteobacteria bacterium]|nr:cell division protein FtsZ [Gammaproteobacteria bacterium]